MDTEQIYKTIVAYKDGITTNINGSIPNLKGFGVSITDNKISLEQFNNQQFINTFLKGLITDIIEQDKPNLFIGSWFDNSNNSVCIDETLNILDKAEALLYAKLFKQRAIYNFETNEVIEVL